MRGQCLLALDRDNKDEARRAFVTARDFAKRQGAILFERRAEAALAQLGDTPPAEYAAEPSHAWRTNSHNSLRVRSWCRVSDAGRSRPIQPY